MEDRKNVSQEFADFVTEAISETGFAADIREPSKFGGYLVIRLKPESYGNHGRKPLPMVSRQGMNSVSEKNTGCV